jgi:hypothetical protein
MALRQVRRAVLGLLVAPKGLFFQQDCCPHRMALPTRMLFPCGSGHRPSSDTTRLLLCSAPWDTRHSLSDTTASSLLMNPSTLCVGADVHLEARARGDFHARNRDVVIRIQSNKRDRVLHPAHCVHVSPPSARSERAPPPRERRQIQ